MDYLIISTLIAEVLVLSRCDQRMFGTKFTPFTFLAYPYMVVVLLAFFFASRLGFFPLYVPSVLIWIVGLFVFWATGFVLWLVFDSPAGTHSAGMFATPGPSLDTSIRLSIGLGLGMMPVMALGLYKSQVATGGWDTIGGDDFRSVYLHGLPAHAVQLAVPLCAFLMATYRKGQKLQLFTISGLLFFVSCSRVKGTILSTILAAVIFRAMGGELKLTAKKIVAVVATTYGLFNVVYLAGLSAADSSVLADPSVYGFLARHYMYYMWAGVLGFGEAIRTNVGVIGGPWYLIFAPFINIYRFVLRAGSMLVPGGPLQLGVNVDPLDPAGDGTSNVFTMLGTLYYYLGPFGGMLLMGMFGLFCYGLLIYCKRQNNEWLLICYCMVGVWLVFGFFEYYFASGGFPETIVDCALLAALVRWKTSHAGTSAHLDAMSHLAPRRV